MAARFDLVDPRMKRASLEDFSDAMHFFDAIGQSVDQWQADLLKNWLATDDRDGSLIHTTCGLSVPRQNGKSYLLELRILFGIVILQEKILFSAHEVRSAKEIFARLSTYFEDDNFPFLKDLVKNIRKTNGQEEIILTNGGSVKFMARSKGAGRGFTVDTIIFDEAQQLSMDSVAAMSPTMNTSKRGQMIYAGTPAFDAILGEEFTRFRNSVIEEKNLSYSTWTEFSASQDDDIDDEYTWMAANPAIAAGRIGTKAIVDNRARLSEDQFKREILGMWDTKEGASVIDVEHWHTLVDDSSEIAVVRKSVISVDISPARTTSTIAVSGYNKSGKLHVEVVDNRGGTAWIVPTLIKMREKTEVRRVVIDGGSPAGSLIDDLKRNRFRVEVMGTRDAAAAAAQFVDAVNESALVHIDQPVLNMSVANARKRKIGDSFAFARAVSTTDITSLVASAQAAWGANKFFKQSESDNSSINRVKVFKW